MRIGQDKRSIHYARKLDDMDVLARYRDEFYQPAEAIYLDGNSLGLLSKRAERALLTVLDSWKTYGIDGWLKGTAPWFYLSEKLGSMTAPLIGAEPEETIVTGSTTTNLHQLAATFFQPQGNKAKILADALAFPTDIYALTSQLQLRGLNPREHLVKVKSDDGQTLKEEHIIARMTDDIALIVLPSALYRSGQVLDMKRLTRAARERDIPIGFDLCHSIGAMPHALSEWGADFAFWCNYKHLNGGPGAVGGLYVNKRHFGTPPGLAGWFGSQKEKQFDLSQTFTPAPHAGAYQMGTPHVLSAAPLLGALDMLHDAGIERIRRKSLQLTGYMMYLIDVELAGYGFTVVNPRDDVRRGGHIYVEHAEAARICKALKANKVIPDFRPPRGIRLAPAPLYNTFSDVWEAVHCLKAIMDEKQYKMFTNERGAVT